MNNSLLSKFSKRHQSDHHSSSPRKENKPEENRTTVAHIWQLDIDTLVCCYLFIMLFYCIWSDSRLRFQFLLHCNIEMQYKKVFYKYLHSKDSRLGSPYTKGNTKVSYTKLVVSASCIFKWRIGHKIVEIIFSIWIWNEWWICIFYVQSHSFE